MFRQRVLHSAVAAVLIVAGACGSNGDAGSTTSQPSEVADSARLPPADDQASSPDQDRSAKLVGRWEVTNYQLPDGGGLTNVVGDAPVFMEFGDDGTVGYHTGCNAGGSTYATAGTYVVPESALDDAPEGQAIDIGPLFEQEEEGCDGFLGDQDRDLPANMDAVTRFIIDGDRLLLLDEFLLIETTMTG